MQFNYIQLGLNLWERLGDNSLVRDEGSKLRTDYECHDSYEND